MGEGSLAWLASAATVAASAPGMRLADARPLLARIDQDRLNRILKRRLTMRPHEIHVSEPEMHVEAPTEGAHVATGAKGHVTGKVQRFGDGVDTDAIIPALPAIEEYYHKLRLGVPRVELWSCTTAGR